MPNMQNFGFIVSSWWKFGQYELVFYQILVFTDAAPWFFWKVTFHSFDIIHSRIDIQSTHRLVDQRVPSDVFFPSVHSLTNNRNHNQILVDSDCY